MDRTRTKEACSSFHVPVCRVLPNKRLKLAARVPNGSGGRTEMRRSRIPFVNDLAWRRSLSAPVRQRHSIAFSALHILLPITWPR